MDAPRRTATPAGDAAAGAAGAAAAPPASKFLATGEMPWRPFDEAPGVAFRVLKTHRPSTAVTLMLRFEPGSAYPAHRHPGGEEYYVLDGELIDGATRYGPGTYVWHPPGSAHAPRSESGAVVLIVLPVGIEIL